MFNNNSDRVSVLMSNIEKMLVELAKVTAKEFNDHELRDLYVNIEVDGRTDGDVLIKFKVGNTCYNKSTTEGSHLMETYQEFARRMGWSKVNDALMLTFNSIGDVKEPSRSDPLSSPFDPADPLSVDDLPF